MKQERQREERRRSDGDIKGRLVVICHSKKGPFLGRLVRLSLSAIVLWHGTPNKKLGLPLS